MGNAPGQRPAFPVHPMGPPQLAPLRYGRFRRGLRALVVNRIDSAALTEAASFWAGVLIGPPPKAHELRAYPPPCLSTFFGTSPRRSRRT
jgi:hypothetical protein